MNYQINWETLSGETKVHKYNQFWSIVYEKVRGRGKTSILGGLIRFCYLITKYDLFSIEC